MTPSLGAFVLGLYYAVLGVLALYGSHRLLLVLRCRRPAAGAAAEPAPPDEWPRVTVQLPLYNEIHVARRLLRAVAGLDYPRDRLEIQVLDDSSDDTRRVVADEVAALRAAGVPITHSTRDDRGGFKAGALAAGLRCARGELVCVFDADFVPRADFLRRTVPWFTDPAVGMVQARWGHLNRDFSLLTRVQALLLDGHFLVEHAGRHAAGCFFNFNGTAGVWRRQAIADAGGWQADTLTEDLDLSYRAQLAGWRFVFLPAVVAPAELPVELADFRSQQRRWAQGSAQTARKLLGRVLRSPLAGRVKAEALVHLTANWSYPLMVVLALLVFPAMLLRRGSGPWQLLLLDAPLFGAATLSVLVFYSTAQQAQGGRWWRRLARLPALMGLGIGLSLGNAAAVLTGAWRDGGTFHRTPKYRVEGVRRPAADRYASRPSLTLALEALFALYFLLCGVVACRLGMWLSLPFLALFLHGYATMVALALPRPMRLVSAVATARRAMLPR
ncbi:MAG TPA: glycosyltransferase [Thermoanaerobaculia bacterium]|nr:glycosyltransferase [Thermoanaerobaculia bacterium]